MLYTYPHYYRKFQCIASECEDTCCAGWDSQALAGCVARLMDDPALLRRLGDYDR